MDDEKYFSFSGDNMPSNAGFCSHYVKKTIEWLNEQIVPFVPRAANPPNVPKAKPIEDFWSILTDKVNPKLKNVNVNVKKLPSAENDSSTLSTRWKICMGLGVCCGFITAAVIMITMLVFYNRSSDANNQSANSSSTGVQFRSRWNSTGIVVAGVTNTLGVGSLYLNYPLSLGVDSSNAVYVVDGGNHRIQQWLPNTASGTTVAGQSNAATGSALNFLNYPTDIALDASGNMYILDGGNNRVVYWAVGASVGVLIAGTGVAGSANNQFNQPLGLARDSISGTLYIADSLNHRVMQYLSGASTGILVAGGNGNGTNSNQLYYPRGLLYDASTNSLLIANNRAHNIVRWVLGSSTWTLIVGSSTGVIGNTPQLLSYPTDVILDPFGNMYVSDEGNQRIQYFLAGQTNGSTVAGVTGITSTALGFFNTPLSVVMDSQHSLYVVEYINARVQKFVQY
ncbi:unnamed protein product [Rotaria magnacalcarata]|uniref:NHL repeat containing protein n=1 Tax=Rotaria magnacalcarata TaxID=392030 RepID=A0A816R9I3_9BILA|nr:unnamed protein product [Rotaria magnacalcarata]